jgi:hypothetical protein
MGQIADTQTQHGDARGHRYKVAPEMLFEHELRVLEPRMRDRQSSSSVG